MRVVVGLVILCGFVTMQCSSAQTKNKATVENSQDADSFDDDLPISDPLEKVNRKVFAFNDVFYRYLLNPLATAWNFIMPQFLRVGIDNFFYWIYTPGRLINNLLQAKFVGSAKEVAYFAINGSVGLLGFYDASQDIFGLEKTNEDTDQTLGKWGIGEGAYILYPFIGPRTVRGTFGFVGDLFLQPQTVFVPRYVAPQTVWEQAGIVVGTYTVRTVNGVSLSLGAYEGLVKDSIDPYSFFRDIYLQNTRKNVDD
ncbi:MAG: putative phospholipid-binding lipoprotein MlaA [Turneriella sp.]|nr:putative phospholipid-binding lipoprotein MlaA [Turneriella sp.]